MFGRPSQIPSIDEALPGRDQAVQIDPVHTVLGTSMLGPFPDGLQSIVFGMGCFWGAERKFWQLDGVYTTAVGYAAGHTKNPSYQEVCTGMTGHNEVVLVVFDPHKISLTSILKVFWESHDPTQGMRQGNDVGTQYRSGIYFSGPEHESIIINSRNDFSAALKSAGYGAISSEIQPLGEFYYAESYHQQYLEKNPAGYCGLGGTGVSCSN